VAFSSAQSVFSTGATHRDLLHWSYALRDTGELYTGELHTPTSLHS
jgi:hypothetical protein